MGNQCDPQCVHDCTDNMMDKLGVTNQYMEPSSRIDFSDFKLNSNEVLDMLASSTKIGPYEDHPTNPKDTYEIIKELKQKTPGKIFKIKKKDNGEIRILKVLEKRNAEKKSLTQQEKKDIESIVKLNHPNLIKLFEVYDNEKYLSYICEYCKGKLLMEKIRDYKGKSEVIVASILHQILTVLAYCHKNKIIHACLNPEFIILSKEHKRGYPIIKIYGFGLAKACLDNPSQSDYSPNYFAPEVLLDIYNDKCDLWSSGIILHVLLSAKFPFKGKTNAEVIEKIKSESFAMEEYFFKNVSKLAKDLICKLLKADPEERLSAEAALEHEWFKNLKIEERYSELNLNDIKKLFQNITTFKVSNPVQIISLDYLIKNLESKGDLELKNKLFTIMDINNNGIVSKNHFCKRIQDIYEELGEKMPKETLDKMVDNFDFEDNEIKKGEITFKKFTIGICDINTILKDDNLQKAYKNFDKANSNKITQEEVMNALTDKNEYSKKEIHKALEKADSDKNGSVEFDEYKVMMQDLIKNP
ncbi:MAG: protein kinase [archaeon]|nr:protein kinase [archaeon]